jgi:Secretion system C-terminal sorting domain
MLKWWIILLIKSEKIKHIKKNLIMLLFAFIVKAGLAQNYNPTVNSGEMSPSPLLVNGIGECRFNVGNTGNDPLDNLSKPMVMIISLSNGVPNNVDPVAAITGTYANMFNWLYDVAKKTYQGTQNQVIPGLGMGTIVIAFQATNISSASSPQNGFNVNITPPAKTNGSNSTSDDKVSSYTFRTLAGPLPVKLAYFNATVKNCMSSLNWKSVSEENFSGYEVEQSKDGIKFNSVAKVKSEGGKTNYSVKHNAGKGEVYYRLKLNDLDGKIEYSKIVYLDVKCNSGSALVYPNPTKDLININISGGGINKLTTAQLYNGAGQLMINNDLQNGITQFDISKIPAGIYQLKLTNSNGIENIKLVKN